MFKKISSTQETSFRQKITLIILGLFLFIILLEIGLRLGGFIVLSLQEYSNRKAIHQIGTYRILCLGESTTAVGGNDSYPYQLEEILNQRNIGIKFSVINGGVSGTTTTHILERLEDNLKKYKPDMVITMMGINDGENYVFHRDTNTPKIILFLGSFRTYKLFKLLWTHIVNKAREKGINKLTESRLHSQVEQFDTEQVLKKAIEFNPNNDKAYLELYQLYIAQERSEEAKQILKMAINANPKNDAAYAQLGWYYMNHGGVSNQAKEAFREALEINSQNYSACEGLGICYFYQKKFLETEVMLKKALELNPHGKKWLYGYITHWDTFI